MFNNDWYDPCPKGTVLIISSDSGPTTPKRLSPNSKTLAAAGVGAGATYALVNVTMTDGLTSGYVTADKCSTLTVGPQSKSNGNHGVSTAIANMSVIPLDADGSFCLYNEASVNVLADVQGYFGSPATGGQLFTPLPPDRKLDTRQGPLTRPAAGSITRVNTGVATGTTAVLVNMTMTGAAAAGYITAAKCSTLVAGPQTKSSGNYPVGGSIANVAVVPVDSDGSFCIYNEQPVNLVVDLQGSFSPASGGLKLNPTSPDRKLDTRLSPTRPPANSITRVDTGVPAGTTAVLVNLTMTDGDGTGYVTADKCSALSAGPQSKSNGNFSSTAIANLSVVPVDNDGSFCVYAERAVNLVVDLQGSFSPTGSQVFFPLNSNRVLDTR